MRKNRNSGYDMSGNFGRSVLACLCAAGMCLLAGCGEKGSSAGEMTENAEISAEEAAGTEGYSGEAKGSTEGEAYEVSTGKAEWETPLSCTEKVSDKLSFDAEVITADSFRSGMF